MKHTPPPWRVVPGANMNGVSVQDSRNFRVANCRSYSTTIQRDEARANARLIAAAPDLLAAMQEITPFLNEAFVATPGSGERFDALEKFRAAIAKATEPK